MSKLQGWMLMLVLGIVVGNISGYLLADKKSIDTDQLASVIRNELQVNMNRQSTSHYSSDTPKFNDTQQLFTDGEKERFINELKETFRDVAEEIVSNQTSMQHNTAVSDNTYSSLDQEQIQAAVYESQNVLTGAIARGNWSSEDSQNYDAAIQNLSGNELTEAYRQLSVAINNGELTPDPDSVIH
jgi:hypothetical protein